MALTFNGANSGLTRTGNLVSAYPFTMFAWTRAAAAQWGFVAEVAADPGPNGVHEGHGMIADGSVMRAWSTTGSSSWVGSARPMSVGDWVPCMVVFTSTGLRKVYYGNGAVRTDAGVCPQYPSFLNAFAIGRQAVKNAIYWYGDIACVGVWNTELTAAEYATLAAGAVPSTVHPASLVDYWSLLTQAAIQTGVNGRMLAATNTAQAATHPIAETPAGPDTQPPVMNGPLTASAITGTSYTLAWPAASDDVGVSGYERSLDGGATWLDVGNVLTSAVSGRTPGTTDAVQVRARDATGNIAQNPLALSVVLPDDVAPTLSGTISVADLSFTSYSLSWPAGADNIGVVGYEVSVDGGASYASVGNALGTSITGRAPGTIDQVRVRARDAAGNASAPLATTVALQRLPDTTPPVLTGSISVSALTSTSYSLSWPAASDDTGVVAYDVSVDGGVSFAAVGNALGASVSGRTPGATDQVCVRARDAAGNASPMLSASVTLLPVGDTTAPVLTGSLSVSSLTSTSYTLSWPAGTDDVGVVGYERSLDGGASWVSVGNVLTVGVSGRTPGNTDQIAVRARDAGGNVSAPPLATTVTLPGLTGPTFATPTLKNNTGTVLANLTGVTVNVYDANTGALVLRKTGLTSSAGGIVAFSDLALIAGTSYAYEVVTPSSGRRLPIGTAT